VPASTLETHPVASGTRTTAQPRLLQLGIGQLKGKQNVSSGTDNQYEADLEGNLADLYGRVQRGAYRAKPSRRQYIPKPDGRQRPLGIAALEDKIVQRAVVEILNAIYEADFLGFSYGFRPGRSQHQALDALATAISRRRRRRQRRTNCCCSSRA
jgi:RNA-directed DNA polymerase